MKKFTLFILSILFNFLTINGQDKVGIGVINPDEKLEVAGKIFSNQGGFKFPDSTVQTTAAFNTTTSNAALPKLIGYLSVRSISGPITRDLEFKNETSLIGVENLIPVYTHELQLIAGGGASSFGPLKVISDISIASPDLFQAIVTGTSFPTGNLYLLEKIEDNEIVYAEIELSNINISTYDHNQIYVGDQRYAHLNGFSLSYHTLKMIIYFNGGSSSYCWNAIQAIPCP